MSRCFLSFVSVQTEEEVAHPAQVSTRTVQHLWPLGQCICGAQSTSHSLPRLVGHCSVATKLATPTHSETQHIRSTLRRRASFTSPVRAKVCKCSFSPSDSSLDTSLTFSVSSLCFVLLRFLLVCRSMEELS